MSFWAYHVLFKRLNLQDVQLYFVRIQMGYALSKQAENNTFSVETSVFDDCLETFIHANCVEGNQEEMLLSDFIGDFYLYLVHRGIMTQLKMLTYIMTKYITNIIIERLDLFMRQKRPHWHIKGPNKDTTLTKMYCVAYDEVIIKGVALKPKCDAATL